MRYYDTPGGRFPSVTSVLGETVTMPWMPNYIKKWAREALWDMVNNSGPINSVQPNPCSKCGGGDINCSYCEGGPDLGQIVPNIEISDIQYCLDAHKRHSEKALEIGSWVHSAIESYHKLWKTMDCECENEGCSLCYAEFLFEFQPENSKIINTYLSALALEGIKVLESEQTVWHPMGYAGTLDLICEMDGKLWIGDIKTFESKQYKDKRPKKPLFKKEHYAQLEAYRRAYNDNFCRNCDAEIGNKDQRYVCDLLKIPDTENGCRYDLIQNRFILWLDKRDQSNYYLEIIDESLNDKHWDMWRTAFNQFKAWK